MHIGDITIEDMNTICISGFSCTQLKARVRVPNHRAVAVTLYYYGFEYSSYRAEPTLGSLTTAQNVIIKKSIEIRKDELIRGEIGAFFPGPDGFEDIALNLGTFLR